MTPEEIGRLIGAPTAKDHDDVLNAVAEARDKIESYYGTQLPDAVVVFDLRGRVAGIWEYEYQHKIRVNLELLHKNREDMLNETIPHEIAHMAEYAMYGTHGHGPRWQMIMLHALRLNPKRCHRYETTKARKHKPKRHVYRCQYCDKEVRLSNIQHKRVVIGEQEYGHKGCILGQNRLIYDRSDPE